jgi:plastocyanin
MRRTLLAVPLALAGVLAAAAPVGAADARLDVVDYYFSPSSAQVDPGDTVTWSFVGPTDHTTTSKAGQAERWGSPLEGPGKTFAHTFTKPGKFQFYCRPHPYMTGTVTVGSDAVAKSFTRSTVKGGRGSVTASVTLAEAAKVTLTAKAKGRKAKSVTKRLAKGKRKLRVGRLAAGSYKVTLVAVDDFDRKTSRRATARVR